MDGKKIINELKEETRPDLHSLHNVEEFLAKLQQGIKKSRIKAEVFLGGSLAKGTHLKDQHDVDIFVRFDYSYSEKDISVELKKILKQMKLIFEEVHGSRNYFQIRNDMLFELVPVLKVEDSNLARNVADMSPLHVKYFKSKAKKITRDEIRVTKMFLKAARIYGAESYIKGFSGHIVDLLILQYGSFMKLVEKAAGWKPKVIIDNKKQHKDVLMSMNASKIKSPLVIVDPVQKERNAAAALSKENFYKFIFACRKFLKKPSKSFFIEQDFEEIVNAIVKKHKNCIFYSINIKPLKGKDDVVGSKILKIKEYLEYELVNLDFNIVESDWDFSPHNSKIVIGTDKKKLSLTREISGPPVEMEKHVKNFKKTHSKTKIVKGKIVAVEKRKFVNADKALLFLLKSKYVKERCKSAGLGKVF